MKKRSILKVVIPFFAGLWLLAPGCTPGTDWNPGLSKTATTQTIGGIVAQSAIPNTKQGESLLTFNLKELKTPGGI